jgi:hypothetical protein
MQVVGSRQLNEAPLGLNRAWAYIVWVAVYGVFNTFECMSIGTRYDTIQVNPNTI